MEGDSIGDPVMEGGALSQGRHTSEVAVAHR